MKKAKDPLNDYSAPAFSDPGRLIEFRNLLGLTQMELAQKTEELFPKRGVSQGHISAIERGDKPFSEPARTKIWTAIIKLNDEFMKREGNNRAASNIPTGADMTGQTFTAELLKLMTPLERVVMESIESKRKQEEYEKALAEDKESIEGLKHQIDVLKQERGSWMKQAEAFRKMAEMNIGPLIERIGELEKKVEAQADLIGKRSEQVAKEAEADEAKAKADEAQRKIGED
jgi:transcriptional regulator with XRE-family HTH domain